MVFIAEPTSGRDQVWPSLRSPRQGVGPSPAGDPAVVARTQDLGHGPAPELGGPGVVGVLEQALAKGLVLGRLLVAHHARDQSGHGLDDHEGGRLTTGEHVIADRQLVVHEVLAHAFVHALIAPAQQREPVAGRQRRRHGLIEPAPARTEQEERTLRIDGLHRREDRLGREHHPGAAAERRVVHRAVAVGRVIAQIMNANVEDATFPRLAEQAARECRVEELGQTCEEVDPHERALMNASLSSTYPWMSLPCLRASSRLSAAYSSRATGSDRSRSRNRKWRASHSVPASHTCRLNVRGWAEVGQPKNGYSTKSGS